MADVGTFRDPRDRNLYKCVKIGKQVWFAENLRFQGLPNRTLTFRDREGKTLGYSGWKDPAFLKNAPPKGWRVPTFMDLIELLKFVEADSRAMPVKYIITISYNGQPLTFEREVNSVSLNWQGAEYLAFDTTASLMAESAAINFIYRELYNPNPPSTAYATRILSEIPVIPTNKYGLGLEVANCYADNLINPAFPDQLPANGIMMLDNTAPAPVAEGVNFNWENFWLANFGGGYMELDSRNGVTPFMRNLVAPYYYIYVFGGPVGAATNPLWLPARLIKEDSELPHDDPTPWHLVDDTDRLASARMKVSHHFQAVRKNRIDQHRIVTIQPMQGDRQVNYRVAGIGGVLDLTCRIEWNGSARFTRLWYEVK